MLKKTLPLLLSFFTSFCFAYTEAPTNTAYLSLQSGYANNHINNLVPYYSMLSLPASTDGKGVAGRAALGVIFADYFGFEAGYTYFPIARFTVDSIDHRVHTYAFDLVGKLQFFTDEAMGLYVKAGANYLRSKNHYVQEGNAIVPTLNAKHINLIYGAGVARMLTDHISIDISYTHYSGHDRVSIDYLPDIDLYAAGVQLYF